MNQNGAKRRLEPFWLHAPYAPYGAAPSIFLKIDISTDMKLNRNLAEETHVRIDK